MSPGDTAPDPTLLRPDGTPVTLAAFRDREFLLLVFLRHLAWIACNAHLGEVDAARERLAAAGCSVLVVSQAKPEVLSLYLSRRAWGVPVVCDPDRVAYRAFGLERTSWLTFFRPRVLWGYFRGMLRGYGVRMPYAGEDVMQLGGDFLLDKLGRVVLAHPSADPADRPSVGALLGAIRSARPMGAEPPADARHVDTPPAPD